MSNISLNFFQPTTTFNIEKDEYVFNGFFLFTTNHTQENLVRTTKYEYIIFNCFYKLIKIMVANLRIILKKYVIKTSVLSYKPIGSNCSHAVLIENISNCLLKRYRPKARIFSLYRPVNHTFLLVVVLYFLNFTINVRMFPYVRPVIKICLR